MAVGDNYNDREMLEFAGTGVAMGNSVAELLEGAFHVTGSNDEAGLAQAIERFALDDCVTVRHVRVTSAYCVRSRVLVAAGAARV